MHKRAIIIISALAIVSIIGLYFVMHTKVGAPESNNQNQNAIEQNNEAPTELDSELATNLDVSTQPFTLTEAALSCSTTPVEEDVKHNCTGKIYIVPSSNEAYNPAMYKISEQTKLLQNGQLQDSKKLEELAQSKTTIRLKMADNSSDTIAEINY